MKKRLIVLLTGVLLILFCSAPALAVESDNTICTGDISVVRASKDEIVAQYHWTWNDNPLIKSTDQVAFGWDAYTTDSMHMDVDVQRTIDVQYYNLFSGEYNSTHSIPISDIPATGLYSCAADIPMVRRSNGHILWAKTGTVNIIMRKMHDDSADIGSIQLCAAYGHKTLLIEKQNTSNTTDWFFTDADLMPIPNSSGNTKRLAATTASIDHTGDITTEHVASKQEGIADIHTCIFAGCNILIDEFFT